ncbi:DUF2333 family protein [Halomonas sp. JS92-SW72]|uniref:DUF2333 family protein n=1 Tax=Halomonas sp. JS92-SW72 TaxID=2306583 RepID=UPI0019694151|nr:DUF2333 family protein [Halomonas sp. JS92-SW72]
MAWKSWRAARRRRKEEALERPRYGWIWKPLVALAGLYFLVTIALGIWWSQPPAPFDVEQATLERRGEAAYAPAARGTVTVATLAETVATLLDKPGGYLRNDIAPPGVWLDNMPNWELGVLEVSRDLARALPGMAAERSDPLEEARERLEGDDRDWFYPTTEQRLEQAVAALDAQLGELGADRDGFVPGQGLGEWLERSAARLDDLALRLAASVGSHEALTELAVETESLPPRTPWHRVDDIFFEARGTGWALAQLLEGVQRDQADVLAESGAEAEWERLLAELSMTQRRLWSPVVLNGSGFGLFANHSLVMALHMTRARDLAAQLAERLAEPPAALAAPAEATASIPEEGEEAEPVEPPVVEVERLEEELVEPPPEGLAAPEE